MRLGIAGWGSEGDLRPLVALGARLKREGHEVRLALSPVDQVDWGAVCREQGLEARIVPERVEKSLQAICEASKSADLTAVSRALLEEAFFPYLEAMYEASLDLCAKSEAVIGLFSSWYVKAACLKAGVPFASVHYYPGMLPSREVPPVGFPAWRWLNPTAWALFAVLIDLAFKKPAQAFWAKKGLPPLRRALTDANMSERLNLVACSPSLFAAPADWAPKNQLCGHFTLPAPQGWRPTADLEAFLADGPKPVLASLGTLEHLAPQRARDLVVGAARAAKVRAIVQTKCAGGEGRDGDLFFLRWAPHDALLPRCAAMVLHGGAGTTHAALAAGVPAVVVPFIFEQKLWGRLLQRAGSATEPLPFWKATPETLAGRIVQALGSDALAKRASHLGHAVRAEDGTGQATRALASPWR